MRALAIISGQGWTFDTVASDYEKMRPGYPGELYRALLQYQPLSESSDALEIGIGAGQATLPILQTGCKVTAVEYGEHFSRIVRKKFRAYPGFAVITGKFEDTELTGKYDLIYSAAAFHWIPEEIGYTKVFSLFKNGGAFARFACHPDRITEDPDLSEEIDGVYAEYYYPFYHKPPEKVSLYDEKQAKQRAFLAEKYSFTDIQYAMFHRTRSFSAKEYTALLGTYSDHIAIEEGIRSLFFAEIENTIERHGGRIVIHDTIDLEMARKP